MKPRIIAALVAIGLVLTVIGCTEVSTGPDQKALHYEGGAFTSKKFHDCVGASDRQFDGPGDKHYSYPSSQRNLAFPDKGDKTDAITFVTKDGIEMKVSGVLNFLLNTSCDKITVEGKEYKGGALQVFHELIGNRYEAYMDDGKISDGWIKMLGIYLFRPLDTAVDRAGQNYTYLALYNDPAVKAAWENEVLSQLPALVNRQTDGEVEFFGDFALTLQKPDPPDAIKQALIDRQEAIAQAESEEAKAAAAAAAAEAEVAVSLAQAKKQKAEIEGFGGFDNYLQWFMASHNLNPLQPVILYGGSPQAQPTP